MVKLKHILFGLLMIMTGLPLLQRAVPVFTVKPLKGSFDVPAKPSASWESVFNGTFQDAFNNYFEHTIGFRPLLVRVNNQIAYSVFDTAQAAGVVIGKHGYLFEINYIKAYRGWDFAGDETIRELARKSAYVDERLKAAGKTLLFVLAPGKASFFPEYIPSKYYEQAEGENTNYRAIKSEFEKLNLPLLDFNSWFIAMKDTVTFPLYPQCGIHWSAYGVGLALDSIINRLEQVRNIDMVDFWWDGFDLPDTLRNPDYDIAEGMNLLFKIPHYPMAYPKFRFSPEEGKVKPNAIVVADSYHWNLYGTGLSSRIFGDDNFWYYNQQVHNPGWPGPKRVQDLDLGSELGEADVIIIMATEANLFRYTFGFIDNVYDLFAGGGNLQSSEALREKEAAIAEIMKSMDSSPDYRKFIQEKAVSRGIPYEEMLKLDAEWLWNEKQKKEN